MVFHNIESLRNILADQRIIIYYIEGIVTGIKRNDIKLCKKVLEVALEMLEKKNEDVLIIKVLHGSDQFIQFDELYKPDVTGAATLLVVNNEGIPLMCEQINHADNVSNIIESLCNLCKLNRIDKLDISKITTPESESASTLVPDKVSVSHSPKNTSFEKSLNLVKKIDYPVEPVSVPTVTQAKICETEKAQPNQSLSTEIRIILPNGNRVTHKFDKNALLQEVWFVVKTTYNLVEFDLKTFDRQQAFSEAEYKTTLDNLKLYPNGVILVVLKNIIPFNNNQSINQFLYQGFAIVRARATSAVQYIQGLFSWFWNSFLMNNNNSGNDQSGTQRTLRDSNDQSNSNKRPNRPKPPSKSFGNNVHTLRNREDSDDENNRYNGNSTQQK